MLDRLRFDLTTALRSLAATPLPVAAAVVTLGLSAGLNLAMSGLIDRALMSPPPRVVDPARVVALRFGVPGDDAAPAMATVPYPVFAAVRDDVPTLAAVAAWQRASTSAMVDGEQVAVDTMLVSGAYFPLLGARAAAGRAIGPDDDRDANPVVVLSHAFWQSAFRGDPSVMGRPITVRGDDYIVAGVMPPGFTGHASARVDLWMPFAAGMLHQPGWEQSRFQNVASVIGRLAPASAPAAVETQAETATGRPVSAAPIAGLDVPPAERRIAYWLGGIAVLVFIAGLANAGTLLLVRAARRRRELAVRASLGASWSRLAGQAWIEAVVLAAAATAVAVVLSAWLDDAIRRGLFPALAEANGLGAWRWIGAGLVVVSSTLVAGVINGSHVPALARLADRASAMTPRRRTIGATLLALQTTMTVVLLAGTGMFASSLFKLAGQDFGMRMRGVYVVDTEPGPASASLPADLYTSALDRVRALPGVEAATIIGAVPFAGFSVPPISVPGLSESPNTGGQLPNLIAATPELFDILDIPIVEGRGLADAGERGPLEVVVNQSMAQQVWPGRSAVGQCIRIGFDPAFDPSMGVPPGPPSAAVPCREVVGVARDTRQRSVLPDGDEARLMQYYVPYWQTPLPPFAGAGGRRPFGLLVRANGALDTVVPAIRRLVVDGRGGLPFIRVREYASLLDRQLRPWRMGTTLLSMFAAIALGVAAIGLYAAFAHVVHERRREVAIRMAVGAAPSGVARSVVGDAWRVTLVGIVAGSVVVAAAGRWVQALLYDTAPADPWLLASAGAAMLLVTTLATLGPARAAARQDPSALLRSE